MAAGEGFPLKAEHACPRQDRKTEQREGAHPAADEHLQQTSAYLTVLNSHKSFHVGEDHSNSKLAICVLSVTET